MGRVVRRVAALQKRLDQRKQARAVARRRPRRRQRAHEHGRRLPLVHDRGNAAAGHVQQTRGDIRRQRQELRAHDPAQAGGEIRNPRRVEVRCRVAVEVGRATQQLDELQFVVGRLAEVIARDEKVDRPTGEIDAEEVRGATELGIIHAGSAMGWRPCAGASMATVTTFRGVVISAMRARDVEVGPETGPEDTSGRDGDRTERQPRPDDEGVGGDGRRCPMTRPSGRRGSPAR
jgi:hypothetical protein